MLKLTSIKIILVALSLSCVITKAQALSEIEITVTSIVTGCSMGLTSYSVIKQMLDREVDIIANLIVTKNLNQLHPSEIIELAHLIKTRNKIIALLYGTAIGTAVGFGTQAALNYYDARVRANRSFELDKAWAEFKKNFFSL